MLATKPRAITPIRWTDFSGGLNTKAPSDQLGDTFTPDCSNVYWGMNGEIITRAGITKFDSVSLAAQLRRIFDFQYGSSQKLIVYAGTTLSFWANPGWTTIVASMAAVNPFLVSFQNYLWFGDGTNMKRYDGTNIRQWGITAPTTAPTTATGAAGNLTGLYQWKVTFVRGGTNGAESNAGPASTVLTLVTQRGELTAIPVSADAQVTARKIYRTEANGATFYYLATIADNTTTVYSDNTADTGLDTTLVAPDDHSLPTAARFGALFKNRIWTAVHNTKTIYFSSLNEPDYFPPANSLTLSTNDADQITGLVSFRDALFAFTEDSIWMITAGYTTSSVSRSKVTDKGGCIAPDSIASTGQVLFYLGDDGAYAFDGSNSELISLEINPTLDALTLAQKQAAVGCYYPKLNQYWLSFPTVPIVYVYDIQLQAWTRYSGTFYAMGLYETTAGTLSLLGGNATYVNTLDSGATDDGVAIAWYWYSPWFDGGGAEWIKCMRRGIVAANAGAAYNMTLALHSDFSGTPSQSATLALTATRQMIRQNLHANAQWFQIRLSGSGTGVKISEQGYYFLAKRRR